MKYLIYISLALAAMFASPRAEAISTDRIPAEIRPVVDSLTTELKAARTPSDSLLIMCDIFDIMPRIVGMDSVAEDIFYLAKRVGDVSTAFDIMRNQANRSLYSDSVLRILKQRTLEWPESQERSETLTFIKMMDNMRRGRYTEGYNHYNELISLLEELEESSPSDIYERIGKLHAVCMALNYRSQSKLLVEYMDSLGRLISALPPQVYSIRNAYNVHAATVFTELDPKRAVEADMRTLQIVDRLKKYYMDKGRVFRNYDATYYTVYARMLSNYQALTEAQIENLYGMAMAIVEKDPAVRQFHEAFPAPEIYYAVYKGDYKKATGLILGSTRQNPSRKGRVLRLLLECATHTGDTDLELKTLRDYKDWLEHEMALRADGAYRDLHVGYANYELKKQFKDLEKTQEVSTSRFMNILMTGSLIFIVVLLVLLAFLYSQHRKNRQLTVSLTKANEQLKAESESLRLSKEESVRARNQAEKANNLKSDFIKNMSHEVRVPLDAITEYAHLIADCSQGEMSKQLAKFSEMIDLNAELLTTIVNDVLNLTDLESSPTPLHPQVVNLQTASNAAISAIRKRVEPGVRIELAPECGPLDLFTDPLRLQQVMNNLLTNAAKFTQRGSIQVAYKNVPEREEVEISVTDTGIGINHEYKEKIFDRFFKLDPDTQGTGLGLTISRLIARRMGGDLKLDTSYRGPGSRFIFTLPKK